MLKIGISTEKEAEKTLYPEKHKMQVAKDRKAATLKRLAAKEETKKRNDGKAKRRSTRVSFTTAAKAAAK